MQKMNNRLFINSAVFVVAALAISYTDLALPNTIENSIALIMLQNLISVDGVLIGLFAALFGILISRERSMEYVKFFIASMIITFIAFGFSILSSFVSMANLGTGGLSHQNLFLSLASMIAGVVMASYSLVLYSMITRH